MENRSLGVYPEKFPEFSWIGKKLRKFENFQFR